MPQSFASLHVHVVFSTKRREPLITPDLAPRLYDYFGGILRAHGWVLVAAGGMPDHVHLLVSLGREISVAEALRTIKANSSKWIHETFANQRGFAWQAGYGAFAVSNSNVPSVKRYIANQAEHHRVRTYQEEFLALLRRHNLAFDESHLWD
jgi:REP element-mobilizing transposase RayT